MAAVELSRLEISALYSAATLAAAFALPFVGGRAVWIGTLTFTVRWFGRYRGRGATIGEISFPAGILVLFDLPRACRQRWGRAGSEIFSTVSSTASASSSPSLTARSAWAMMPIRRSPSSTTGTRRTCSRCIRFIT